MPRVSRREQSRRAARSARSFRRRSRWCFTRCSPSSSIGQLFVAAVVPADHRGRILSCGDFDISCGSTPTAAPVEKQRADWPDVLRSLRRAWAALLLLTVVVGAIYTGICTETEAAALGAGGAFIVAVARRQDHASTLLQVMGETTATTALIYLIIIGVLTFSFAMGVTGLPQQTTEFVKEPESRARRGALT